MRIALPISNGMKKILAFGAHPDDVEFCCGAVLIKEIERGSQVKIVVCSLGEAGTSGTPDGRKKEAEDAAKFIGAEIEFISLGGDSHMQNTPENSFKIAEIIRAYKPNIVITHCNFGNQHPDHLAVSVMTRSACRLARYGGLEELKKNPIHRIEGLYYYPSTGRVEEKPDIIIDISLQHEKWVKAMSFHESQMNTKDYVDLIVSRAKAYGASMAVEYAAILWADDPVSIDVPSQFGSSRNY